MCFVLILIRFMFRFVDNKTWFERNYYKIINNFLISYLFVNMYSLKNNEEKNFTSKNLKYPISTCLSIRNMLFSICVLYVLIETMSFLFEKNKLK